MTKHEPSTVPSVACSRCHRIVKCIQVSDGTIYRPFAWLFPYSNTDLLGVCAACQTPKERARVGK